MKTTNEQKTKLKEILDMISTDEEKKTDITSTKLNALYKYLKSFQEDLKKDSQELKENNLNNFQEIQNIKKKIKPTDYTPVVELLTGIKEILSKPTPVQKQQDLSGFFKDLGTQLVQFGTSTKNTEEIIRNLKWNSTMGIKNRNGSPINPSISPFGIYDYDDIKLSGYDVNNNPATVTYYLSGNQQAILALTYDGSGNLTEAHRTA